MCVLLNVRGWVGCQRTPELSDAKMFMGTVTFSYLVYCCLNVKDSVLIKPHPMMWRMVHGCGVMYMVTLITPNSPNNPNSPNKPNKPELYMVTLITCTYKHR